MLLSNYFLTFWLSLCVDASTRKPSSAAPKANNAKLHAPPQMMNLDPNQPLMAQLIQEDYLVTPEDFSEDPDVKYVLEQLHRNQTVEKYYRTAQTIYTDLKSFYGEIEGDPTIATKFHEFMKKMTAASLSKPLSITNFILGIARHFRPLFKTKSYPIEELARIVAHLEKDPNKKIIRLMTGFFDVYTIRELDHIQNLISLASYSGVDPFTARNQAQIKDAELQAAAMAQASANPDRKGKGIKSTKKRKKKNLQKKQQQADDDDAASTSSFSNENVFETFLKPHSERFRITIANAITKMYILLDLFVNDSSMPSRSIQLYIKLRLVHARRLAAREKVDVNDLDVRWLNPSLYRKLPINFLFDDWKPDILTPEVMEELRRAAADEMRSDKEAMAQRLAQVSQAALHTNLMRIGWIFMLAATFVSVTGFIFFKYRRIAQAKAAGDEDGIVSDPVDDEEERVSEIVTNLERSI